MKTIILIIGFSIIIVSLERAKDTQTSANKNSLSALCGYETIAKEIALLDSNSTLLRIFSQNINEDGTSNEWVYDFVSSSRKKIISISYKIIDGNEYIEIDSTENDRLSNYVIISKWIDCSIAFQKAKIYASNRFKNRNYLKNISAELLEKIVYNSVPTWEIISYTEEKGFIYKINAINGKMLGIRYTNKCLK